MFSLLVIIVMACFASAGDAALANSEVFQKIPKHAREDLIISLRRQVDAESRGDWKEVYALRPPHLNESTSKAEFVEQHGDDLPNAVAFQPTELVAVSSDAAGQWSAIVVGCALMENGDSFVGEVQAEYLKTKWFLWELSLAEFHAPPEQCSFDADKSVYGPAAAAFVKEHQKRTPRKRK